VLGLGLGLGVCEGREYFLHDCVRVCLFMVCVWGLEGTPMDTAVG
jgi:hypothetical protein